MQYLHNPSPVNGIKHYVSDETVTAVEQSLLKWIKQKKLVPKEGAPQQVYLAQVVTKYTLKPTEVHWTIQIEDKHYHLKFQYQVHNDGSWYHNPSKVVVFEECDHTEIQIIASEYVTNLLP